MITAARREPDDDAEPFAISAEEAAARLPIDVATVRRLAAVNGGPIPCVKIASGTRAPRKDGKPLGPPRYKLAFRPADIEAWIASQVIRPAEANSTGPP